MPNLQDFLAKLNKVHAFILILLITDFLIWGFLRFFVVRSNC